MAKVTDIPILRDRIAFLQSDIKNRAVDSPVYALRQLQIQAAKERLKQTILGTKGDFKKAHQLEQQSFRLGQKINQTSLDLNLLKKQQAQNFADATRKFRQATGRAVSNASNLALANTRLAASQAGLSGGLAESLAARTEQNLGQSQLTAVGNFQSRLLAEQQASQDQLFHQKISFFDALAQMDRANELSKDLLAFRAKLQDRNRFGNLLGGTLKLVGRAAVAYFTGGTSEALAAAAGSVAENAAPGAQSSVNPNLPNPAP